MDLCRSEAQSSPNPSTVLLRTYQPYIFRTSLHKPDAADTSAWDLKISRAEALKAHQRQNGQFSDVAAMPNHDLPAELLDCIVDILHDSDDGLKNCCLVSKSWIPRARRHLFAQVLFRNTKDLQSWKTTFPDPFTSPACYTRNLSIKFCPFAIAAGGEEGGWIQTFSRTVRFEIGTPFQPATFLLPFHGFSPALKTLHVYFTALPSTLVFDFACSFPLLEDLSVSTRDAVDSGGGIGGKSPVVQPSSPPPFTGMLKLCLETGRNSIPSRLLSLPKGPHFRKLWSLWFSRENALLVAALVERCSPTLEHLMIGSGITCTSGWHPCSRGLLTFACS
jgi:hypothetical protein